MNWTDECSHGFLMLRCIVTEDFDRISLRKVHSSSSSVRFQGLVCYILNILNILDSIPIERGWEYYDTGEERKKCSITDNLGIHLLNILLQRENF